MVVCLTSARFNMKADILRQGQENTATPETGDWITTQDTDSGELIRVWQPNTQDDPNTPQNEAAVLDTFRCLARGIVDGGIRVAGTTERFSELYDAVDYVRIWFPANTKISRRDRITNIRDPRGNILWREEERSDNAPTIFNVVGVTPVIDPFGKHVESVALLERVETQ